MKNLLCQLPLLMIHVFFFSLVIAHAISSSYFMFCICTIFVFDFFQQSGFMVDGVVRADLPSHSCFAGPFDLCMYYGMRIKN